MGWHRKANRVNIDKSAGRQKNVLSYWPGKLGGLTEHSVKGKGVDSMENQLIGHYHAPKAEQVESVLNQIGGGL